MYYDGDNKAENKDWQARWEDAVKNDFDYDGDFLTKIVYKKLQLMANYYTDLLLKTEDTDAVKPVLNEILFCEKLAYKVLNYNYGKAASEELGVTCDDELVFSGKVSDEQYKLWQQANDKASDDRDRDTEALYSYIGKYVNWWCA